MPAQRGWTQTNKSFLPLAPVYFIFASPISFVWWRRRFYERQTLENQPSSSAKAAKHDKRTTLIEKSKARVAIHETRVEWPSFFFQLRLDRSRQDNVTPSQQDLAQGHCLSSSRPRLVRDRRRPFPPSALTAPPFNRALILSCHMRLRVSISGLSETRILPFAAKGRVCIY